MSIAMYVFCDICNPERSTGKSRLMTLDEYTQAKYDPKEYKDLNLRVYTGMSEIESSDQIPEGWEIRDGQDFCVDCVKYENFRNSMDEGSSVGIEGMLASILQNSDEMNEEDK